METGDKTPAPAGKTGTSTVSAIIKAPRQAVYQACINPDEIAKWRVPDNMKAEVHAFDAREGGKYRMSLKYLQTEHPAEGKTSGDTDTFAGRFVEIVPGEKIVEVIEFEAADAKFAGEMKITTSFRDVAGGTGITLFFEGIPPGVRPEDNETGTRQSLEKLAALLE